MQCYSSCELIFDTVIMPKSVYMIVIDTYIRLCLTHTDLQINVCVNIKSLKYLSFTTTCVGIFL